MDDRNETAHERYLRLLKLMEERDEDLSHAFDDMRRSRAVQRISWMAYLDCSPTRSGSASAPERETPRCSWPG
ncbi:MAG TPA: hypothetical protein VEQ60_21270 [Longimicrobium sp.]|nr:hypothetical protein [Longimicrobium sp.]